MKLESIVGLIVLALLLLLLFWAVPAVSRLFQRLRPKKPGWRAHWGLEGPMPKDYRGRNPWPSSATFADEQRMEFMSGGGKKLSYSSLKLTYYTFGGGGVFFCLVSTWAAVSSYHNQSLVDWIALIGVWLVAFSLFAIGYHYQRKEDQEEYPPSFIFDREKGTVTVPQFAKLPGGEFPFEDVEGYFLKSPANQFGLQTHFLQLVVHAPGGEQPLMSFILWAGPILGYEQALAHWSRLCQYMNKAEPLPNIPQLWEAMADRLITDRGWQGRAGREAAMDEIAHAFAQEMRAQEVKEGLGVDPHVDPASPEYEGPRSYEHYRHRYPTEA
jgi:hypothetical protein